MKTRVAITLAMVLGGAGFSFRLIAAPVPAVVNGSGAVATAVMAGDEAAYTYVGSKKCKKCHIKQHKSWAKTKMGKAFETLKPGEASEGKAKANVDAAKDFTTDTKCLKCHTTGFGSEGGYATPDPENKKAVRKAKARHGVGCESCHGPGSAYVKVFAEIQKSKRKYKVEELHAVGLNKIDEKTCTACHNDQSPTFDTTAPFDFKEMKEKEGGLHEHFPLEQREE